MKRTLLIALVAVAGGFGNWSLRHVDALSVGSATRPATAAAPTHAQIADFEMSIEVPPGKSVVECTKGCAWVDDGLPGTLPSTRTTIYCDGQTPCFLRVTGNRLEARRTPSVTQEPANR